MYVRTEKGPHVQEIVPNEEEIGTFYPMGTKLILITVSLMLAVFCVALDNTVRPTDLVSTNVIGLRLSLDHGGRYSTYHGRLPRSQ